jgi:hypothetical protein
MLIRLSHTGTIASRVLRIAFLIACAAPAVVGLRFFSPRAVAELAAVISRSLAAKCEIDRGIRGDVPLYQCFNCIQGGAINFLVRLTFKERIALYVLKFENEIKTRIKMFAGHRRQLLDAVCDNRISMVPLETSIARTMNALAAAALIAGVVRRMKSIATLAFTVAIGALAFRQLMTVPNAAAGA